MEQNKPTAQEVEPTDDIIAKARANKKGIMLCVIVLLVVVIGAMAWLLVAQNGSRKADEAIAKADIEQNDSVAMALYTEAAKAGYKSGNRAKAEVAVRLYKEAKYEEAIKYLDGCSLDDNIAAAGVYSLKGDCYANLQQYDKAVSNNQKAISKANGNPEIVPMMLIKEANVFRTEGKYSDEAKAYKTILDDYPQYAQSMRIDIRKYYERAAAQAK